MQVYLDLVRRVLDEGVVKPSRTGVDTLSLFSANYQIDLAEGYPLLTTKRMNFKAVLYELLWYLSGEDHIRNLRKHTRIWDAWADEDGRLDTAYGYYWRHFPSARRDDQGQWQVREIDQIQYILDTLRTNPTSRRMVLTAWEPGNAVSSRLPPCHYTCAFHVSEGWLNCHLTQRSGDIALGIPFNMAAYAVLTQILAQQSNLQVGRFSHTIVDAHIYMADPDSRLTDYDHVAGLRQQLQRQPFTLPRLEIAQKPIDDLTFEDFRLIDYHCHDSITFKVAV